MTEANIALRQAQAADAWDLARLRFESLVEMGLIDPREREGFVRRAAGELFQHFQEERITAWLLVVDGIPRGCACALFWRRLPYPGSSLHAEIAGVYVAPCLRRQGYASELVREAIQAAHARGVRKITLSPTEVGRSMYERLGFKSDKQMSFYPSQPVRIIEMSPDGAAPSAPATSQRRGENDACDAETVRHFPAQSEY